jgi:hypothetical protein
MTAKRWFLLTSCIGTVFNTIHSKWAHWILTKPQETDATSVPVLWVGKQASGDTPILETQAREELPAHPPSRHSGTWVHSWIPVLHCLSEPGCAFCQLILWQLVCHRTLTRYWFRAGNWNLKCGTYNFRTHRAVAELLRFLEHRSQSPLFEAFVTGAKDIN